VNKLSNSLKIKRLLEKSLTHCQQGQFLEAKLIYEELLRLVPNHPQVLSNLGTIEIQLGDIKKGISYIEKSIKVDPKQPGAISNLANGLLEIEKFEEAIQYYNLALKLDSNFVDAYYNKARALKFVQKYEEAILNYEQAIKLNPQYSQAIVNLGFLYNELKEYDKSLKQYNLALNINPHSAETLYNRGIVYENLNEFENALDDYNLAIKIKPNFADAYNNKSGVFRKLQRYEEAIDIINQSIKIDPNNSVSINKKGLFLFEKKDFDGALNNFNWAIELSPNFADALFNKAILMLSQENYEDGWKFYEARWEAKKLLYIQTSKPELLDFHITQKNILVWSEQGIGDEILYSSLLQDAFKVTNNFIVTIDPRMLSLYQRSFKNISNVNFISSKKLPNEASYDFHLPIGNLGKFFRNSLGDFKDQPFNYLISDIEKSMSLKKAFKNSKKFICGIAWKSKNKEIGADKSLSLKQLLPILELPDIDFISLQYGDTEEEVKSLYEEYGIEIKTIDEIDNFNDIDGLSSLIDACDFVITSSNITAHLSGALGKKTYLFVAYNVGKIWYWHENRNKSLWYPAVNIYRQESNKSWNFPIENVISDVKEDHYGRKN
jgi:tetratricopeptide (TPR) repeat protein/ADP-heptose:LPS heptosyltransferase